MQRVASYSPGVFVRQTRKLNDEEWRRREHSMERQPWKRYNGDATGETKCHTGEWLRSAGPAVSFNDDIASRVIARKTWKPHVMIENERDYRGS